MKIHRFYFTLLFYIILVIIIQNIPKIESTLKCVPDYKSKGDNYSSLNDPQDHSEYFYGYEFNHKVGDEYYDHWKGIYWDAEKFCYDAYDNFTRPSKLSDLEDYEIEEYDVVTNLNDVGNKDSYILIEHDQSNLINFHKKMCMTKTHDITNYNHGEYELLIKMDKLFEKDFLNTPHHFYFTIENPSNENVIFSFKVRNFVNITEEMNTTIEEWGPDPEQCLEEEVSDEPEENQDSDQDEETSNDNNSDINENTDDLRDSDITKENEDFIQETTLPCEREIILLNETFLNWTEEYPIPEVFYFTNNYTIEPHKSMTVNISLTFEKNDNETEGGYFIISEETGKSPEPFYWPEIMADNGKLEKLTNMEIILESDLTVGISSFSLMRRRNKEEESYLGEKCNVKNREGELNGKCGDGFYCEKAINGTKCIQSPKKECKNYDLVSKKCSECFLISVDGQWNPPNRGTKLDCDLDYIDITKTKIEGQGKIEVPPAIHWRVTMDFWIWISDTSVLSDAKINMNIVYKDFLAITLRCYSNGLKIYATPLEWLYEYPTSDVPSSYYYKNNVELNRNISDFVNFLRNKVGSYGEVTLEDLVKDATSNWVYVRYAFNLDSSKHYLNDLPESNLKVAQIYEDQTGMPFHFKKFYEPNKMTYLYFQNFYHPLNSEQQKNNKNITIYLRNLNIFREYMPQNIITKYYNLNSIKHITEFPQLLVSFPFSNIRLKSGNTYQMEGYNYFIRDNKGTVKDSPLDEFEKKIYQLVIDDNVKTLRPPRNFWRLNLLELNKQPETCDFDNLINLKCDPPNDKCFDDNKPFICKNGIDNENPFYLDINNIKCKTYCEHGYMHPPRYGDNIQRLYCSDSCDTGSKQCPSDNYKYTDIHSNFLCSNNFFNLYYKCFDKDQAINNADFSGLYFSSFLRTPSILINLNNEYKEFSIDFWFYHDRRFRYKRYYNSETEYQNMPMNVDSKVVFMSDCCKVNFNGLISFNYASNSFSSSSRISSVSDSNWNHFVLTFFKSTSYSTNYYNYYYTFYNNQYSDTHSTTDYNRVSYNYYLSGSNNVKLSKIVFCNRDDFNDFGDALFNRECKNADWIDGFYRRIQIFDLKYSARQSMFSVHQFEDDGLNAMLKHRFIVGLNTILNNHLIDLVGSGEGHVLSEYNANINQNPDGSNYILYNSNFSPKEGISYWGARDYISSYRYNKPPKLKISQSSCSNSFCTLCNSGNCLSCKEGYSLFSGTCKGNVDAESNPATYFYKNPGKNMPERLKLNIDFNKIINEPYFTLFFFIKVYGFTKKASGEYPIKLLIFHQETKQNGEMEDTFYLAFHPDESSEELSFYVNGVKMFSYDHFRDNNFGYWVPISFTAFRESDRSFKMNMVQASINYQNLELDYDPTDNINNELFPYVKFTQFTITNKWVGLLCDIKIYNKFLLNAWGIIRTKDPDDVGNSAMIEINLRSDSPNSCLSSNEIMNQPASTYISECVADYNPHLKNCGSSGVFVSINQSPSCNSYCYPGTSPYKCLNSYYSYYYEHSYENQSPIWKTYFPTYNPNETGKRISCKTLSFIDYNRYKYARANNVISPQDVWAIDFWFRTSTNQSVRKRGDINIIGESNYDKKEKNNNNFKEFVIEWNYHIKIRVYKEDKGEFSEDVNYKIECTPLVVVEHPDLSTEETDFKDIGDYHYEWAYVACGVNFPERMFYITKNNKLPEEKIFNSKITIIPSELTTLTITENSPAGYGMTFIYQLRLWHCYNCAQAFRNLDYDRSDKNFNEVLHNFDGTDVDTGVEQRFIDEAGGTRNTETMVQVANFPGYTINFEVTNIPVLCDESNYEYYNEEKNSCEVHYNVARSNSDKEITIPSSRNGRYTIDFWFFVENSAELSPGLNLFWENHMSLTILRDTANRNTINAICFPQSYRDNIDGLGGQEIITIYDKAINKDKYAFYQGSSKWNFVRCAVDQTRKRFFINDNIELDLEGEILYGNTRNYRPFRYFKIKEEHKLKLQNARLNPTRIYLRQIKCFREYIDFRLIDLKYIDCRNDYSYWSTCQFYPLVFCFDYGYNSNLYYQIYRETKSGYSTEYKQWYIISGDSDPYYTTFPDIYMPIFCSHGQGGGDKEKCTGSSLACHYRNSTTYFWPDVENNYVKLDTLSKTSDCENACRPPDSYDKRNFCLMEKNKNNIANCASDISNGKQNYYYDKFTCDKGYDRVYYECIDENLVANSAIYFSNIYSFPSVVFGPSEFNDNSEYKDYKTETRIVSYYIEIWMKLDSLNYKKLNTDIEHYLYAFPHQIIKDSIDQKFKYSNKLISDGSYYYTLNSINSFEWNKIIIENSYDWDTKKFNITFYLNYEFDNPEFRIPNLESSLYKLHFRGFGFCNSMDSYCRVNSNPAYLKWGVAWYRNFRVWDADITSLQSIQVFEYGYTQLINALKYYFPLTVEYLEKNTIKDKIDPEKNKMQLNFWTFFTGDYYQRAFDDDYRENYSTDNFDKTYIYENNYISGLNADGTDYLISACASECKRCYSSANTDCYECKAGYCIYGKQCKIRTGFFLKTPPNKPDIKQLEIKIKNDRNFDLTTMNPVTITFFIKFFGIQLSIVKNNPTKINYILICLYKITESGEEKCKTYIGYNKDYKTIVLIIDDIEVYSIKAKNYIGVWTHFGISIYRSNNDYFPNMLNFMIDQQILIQKSDSYPKDNEVKINTFYIDTAPISYYSSLKVFSTFYLGSYGHVKFLFFIKIKLMQ